MKREAQRQLTRDIRRVYQHATHIDYATQHTPIELNSKQRLIMLGTLYAEFGFVMTEAESYSMKRVGRLVDWYAERQEKVLAFREYRTVITECVCKLGAVVVGHVRFIASLNGDVRAADLSLSPNEIIELCNSLAKLYRMRLEHLNHPQVKTVADLCEAIHLYRDTLGTNSSSAMGLTEKESWSLLRLMGRFKLAVGIIYPEGSHPELCVYSNEANSTRAWVRFNSREADDGSYERAMLESMRAWLRLNSKEYTL